MVELTLGTEKELASPVVTTMLPSHRLTDLGHSFFTSSCIYPLS